nr:hypothetical protein Iba_chr04eCG15830 [Ipomoea batatas]
MCTILKARAARGTEFLGLNGLLGEKIIKFLPPPGNLDRSSTEERLMQIGQGCRYAPLTVSLPVSPFSPSHSDDASLHHEPPPPPQPPTPPSTLRCHRLPCEDADAATTSAPALTVDSPTASPLASPLRGCAAACPPPPTASSPPVRLCLGPRQLLLMSNLSTFDAIVAQAYSRAIGSEVVAVN